MASSSTPTPTTPPTRVQDLWFPDGDVVVRAGNTLFRVHAPVLERRAPALRGLLAVSQADPDSEEVDGAPVLVLQDPPEQVTHWLRAMFIADSFPAPPQPTTLDALDAVLRLSHKYDTTHLRTRGMQHLATLFATDVPSLSSLHCTLTDADDTPAFLARTYALARDVRADWALPHALYDLHTTIWADAGALEHLAPPAPTALGTAGHGLGPADYTFGPADYARLFRAARAVVDWWPAEDLLLCQDRDLNRDLNRCARRQTCADMQRGYLSAYMDEWRTDPLRFFWEGGAGDKGCAGEEGTAGMEGEAGMEGIAGMEGTARMEEEEGGAGQEYVRLLCEPCAAVVRSRHEAHSIAFWQAFPAALNLAGWDMLWGLKRRDTNAD
ncbi:hypothetical protein BD626DRAFT_627027 [Schizophyllum amplum]|uniref:BTB domain-containing protein n=1 Tax=Schizophyllum amplum TaxID=97359 RepID=A0A550CNX9_9AGAR|nr:hypothetical protein BD626DRAFT_627027 [Auriculariopsis ampla]